MNKLLIVDGNAILHRVLHTPMKDLSFKGKTTGGVLGMLNRIQESLADTKASSVLVVWDGGKSKRRMDLYPEYKANRILTESNSTPEERYEKAKHKALFEDQKAKLGDVFKCLNVHNLELPNREADDVISWAATLWTGRKEDPRVYIDSGDSDFLQLVSPEVWVLKWVGESRKWVSPENAEAILGCTVDQFLATKIITGDSTDNIHGVKGVGPKTLSDMVYPFLESYSSFNHFLAQVRSWSGNSTSKRVRAISENWGIVDRNAELINIRNTDREKFTEEEGAAVEMAMYAPKQLTLTPETWTRFFMEWGFESLQKNLLAWTHPWGVLA